MNMPKPPWYGTLERKLEGVEWLTDAILIGIICVSVYLLLKGDRVLKTAWAVYLVSP